MPDLSILIPARNEEFLGKTIENILENSEADTEIIAVLDGYWPDPGIKDHPKVHLIHHSESIGQRAATNEAARLSTAKFVMKCDAHCAFDKGFDRKLMLDCKENWTVIPRMYNLHAFDWKCKTCGIQTYQGPLPKKCNKCGSEVGFEKVIIWQPRWSRKSDFMRFDSTLHFQYWGGFEKRDEAKGEISDLLCFLGACFFMHRERYWELGGLDEKHGSWGQMGVEISCKSWLSGGELKVNKKTWFSHMFRTQDGFGFPYKISGRQVENARKYSRCLWMENKWEGAKRPFSWLINKFQPIPDWENWKDTTECKIKDEPVEDVPAASEPSENKKGIVYYTDSILDEKISSVVKKQLIKVTNGFEIITVSLRKPTGFGNNIILNLERGQLSMFKQILAGLEASTAEIIFFCEHDVLYHPSHFTFNPLRNDVYYYNENTYKVRYEDGQALFYFTKQTSGLCAYRELLLQHYKKRVEKVEKDGYSRHLGYEPGCHMPPRGLDSYKAERWMAEFPNIDIRHNTNLTRNRWRQDQFNSPNSCLGWKMCDEVPGWGVTKNRFQEFLMEVTK